MNNEQTVSVPLEPTDEMIVAFAEAWYSKRQAIDDPDMLDAYKAMLAAAPAAQHQGEPVGMLLIDDYFDSREVGEVDVKLDSKVCEQLAANYPGQSLPLYTHADAGEVERLRAENEQLREIIKHSDAQIMRQSMRISNQRAQLAEWDALLRDILKARDWNGSYQVLKKRIDAALSASADPSGPKCCTPTAEEEELLASGDYRPEELWGGSRPTCPKCIDR